MENNVKATDPEYIEELLDYFKSYARTYRQEANRKERTPIENFNSSVYSGIRYHDTAYIQFMARKLCPLVEGIPLEETPIITKHFLDFVIENPHATVNESAEYVYNKLKDCDMYFIKEFEKQCRT